MNANRNDDIDSINLIPIFILIFVLISQNKTQERMNKEIVNGIKLETSDNRSVSIVSIGLIGITVVKF